jgi:hypothetical protein
MASQDTQPTLWSLDSYPLILGAVIVGSALLMAALGLFNLPDPPTDAQIAAAQTYLDGVCASCPVYEIESGG